ncbi:uncharacterized protein LOC143026754 [Oratosquilla oratoria]|uniref:uncharacterized protein LOC143026754 n=1 Tax=Oratosquilla oratoria TaxID=337810 RepID=UPI003F76C8A7
MFFAKSRGDLLPIYTNNNSKRTTPEERLRYLKEELEKKEETVTNLKSELASLYRKWNAASPPEEVRSNVNNALAYVTSAHLDKSRRRIGRKLSALYGGPVAVPHQIDQFINLSSTNLTENQRKFLNLGLNCRYISKRKSLDKRIELEILLDDIQQLERNKKVTTSPDLQAQIIREANTSRGHFRSSLLSPELKAAAKELKDNDAIVIRRADKSSIFVILDKEDYMNKMMNILGDTTKFKQITKNPTNDLKTRLNRIIRCNNSTVGSPKLSLIDGDYKLGYAYGNVKTHKQGFLLRPIISQIPSVTYKLAKRLNELITPYTPVSYSLKSSDEFLDILKSTPPSGVIGSMDVVSLFTHVPVDETIDMIYMSVNIVLREGCAAFVRRRPKHKKILRVRPL